VLSKYFSTAVQWYLKKNFPHHSQCGHWQLTGRESSFRLRRKDMHVRSFCRIQKKINGQEKSEVSCGQEKIHPTDKICSSLRNLQEQEITKGKRGELIITEWKWRLYCRPRNYD
jgi:hypothetical protein